MPPQSVIDCLKAHKQTIESGHPQVVPITKYLPCYRVLLEKADWWDPFERWLDKRETISRKDIENLSKLGEKQWPTLFVATMIWGYGENDDSGPVKLFRAVTTDKAKDIIEHSARLVCDGKIRDGFVRIRDLQDIGASFGTKFLFACGLSKKDDITPNPLVLDRILANALKSLYGKDEADKRFDLGARDYSYSSRALERAGDGYMSYCTEMKELASQIHCDVYQLELFMFREHKNL